ncbi:hypothetical protein GLYMA_19G259500v4 [Glycine max]|uniref:NAC domain-containing protein n=1 Tax=Glycine max TaxID=3847 RepID=K7N0E0_SOYBN|nr:hypothetical protein GYH30_054262 [Glycine max]KRG97234.1 hypothetical protein GLYMA_19G259500v4 [Glycine max]
MPEMKMSICVNGESQVPPGFRFHPTEEELLQYYLRKKVSNEKIDLDVIRDVDLNRLEPWDIQEMCKIGSSPQNDWYLFSHKDKKYPTGSRTNRAIIVGFWKATGRDKVIYSNGKIIGMRKTLVFYKGRAPNGQKSDWIMHEYRLDDINNTNEMEHGWVVCRVFKKKNVPLKTLDSPKSMTMNMFTESDYCGGFTNWESLDQLVASQLNGQTETYCSDLQFPAFLSSSYIATTTHIAPTIQDYPSYDIDLWNHCASRVSNTPNAP